MKRKTQTSKRKLFDPDEIATAISQNLNSDLKSPQQLYGGSNELQEFFSKVQQTACLKKYVACSSNQDGLEKKAYADFLETNSRMGEVNRKFRVPRDIQAGHLSPLELLLVRARALVHWTLRDVTWSEVADNASHSGGVTKGVRFFDTSVEAKFTFPMSTTTGAASLFRQYMVEYSQYSAAIQNLDGQGKGFAEMFDFTEASRATTVDKTDDKRRMIAIEPTVNMFFQQALMKIMYTRLSDVGLDVESLPERHQELAYRGSVDGNLATIDFSSASDCVSIALLRYLLPESWRRYLIMVRCPSMELSGESVDLNMISTMGNAGTFPLETLVFWSIGVATVMQRTRTNPYSLLSLPEERDSVSVFGDDCILPTADALSFMDNARALGFIVNEEKSFYDDSTRFRESCGGDYLRGSNVRPFSLKAPTSTRISALEPWLYIILNGVLPKYESYFGAPTYVYEKALLEYLFGLFRKHKLKVKLVPPDFPDDAGLKSLDWRRLRSTYNVSFDTVRETEQGWLSFRYCRFVYKDKKARDDFLGYVGWLKAPITSQWWKPPRELRTLFPIRRKGGYVVARAISVKME